ncbi:MAG: hypothetical protein KF873_15665 [Gemmataceae bacterium]|nr:hypothetical protein [Gemmataceae bacterium]
MTTPAKSRQRIIDHDEVFTPPALVNAMLDLVGGNASASIRFLEPACGDGNFLAEVLRRKRLVEQTSRKRERRIKTTIRR